MKRHRAERVIACVMGVSDHAGHRETPVVAIAISRRGTALVVPDRGVKHAQEPRLRPAMGGTDPREQQ
jgi:hypothetical protein